jgi:CO dehydrogenase maturation factor
VGNKIRRETDKAFLKNHLSDLPFLGFLPYDDRFIEADLSGISPYEADTSANAMLKEMMSGLGLNG